MKRVQPERIDAATTANLAISSSLAGTSRFAIIAIAPAATHARPRTMRPVRSACTSGSRSAAFSSRSTTCQNVARGKDIRHYGQADDIDTTAVAAISSCAAIPARTTAPTIASIAGPPLADFPTRSAVLPASAGSAFAP